MPNTKNFHKQQLKGNNQISKICKKVQIHKTRDFYEELFVHHDIE